MRLIYGSCLFLVGLSIAGCTGGSAPATVETSEIEQYVKDNPEAVALQEKLDAEAEKMAEEEED